MSVKKWELKSKSVLIYEKQSPNLLLGLLEEKRTYVSRLMKYSANYPSILKALDNLEKNGLVLVKHADGKNPRAKLAELTFKGEMVAQALKRAVTFEQLSTHSLQMLYEARRDYVYSLIERIKAERKSEHVCVLVMALVDNPELLANMQVHKRVKELLKTVPRNECRAILKSAIESAEEYNEGSLDSYRKLLMQGLKASAKLRT